MNQRTIRWGILGAANIARKNWKAIRNSGNSIVAAVASRDPARAQQFIDECQLDAPFNPPPLAVGGYQELLSRPDIDAVYIPLPTGIRAEWVIRAAEAGKHILCEKPCGIDASQVRQMLAACDKHRVQFMDGVMFMHSARMPRLRAVLDDGHSVGTIRRITSQFSFFGPEEFLQHNIRVSQELEPLGALGDLGWYNIRFSLMAMSRQLPTHMSGRLLQEYGRGDGQGKVPLEFSGELFFADGASASFYCSFRTQNQQWAIISGTHGSIHVRDFVLPFYGSESAFEVSIPHFYTRGCSFHMEDHNTRYAVAEYSDGEINSQETNMIRTFASLVQSGQLDASWGEIALQTQRVLDGCLRSAREQGRLVAISEV